jgi:hypothetical protein
VEFKNIAAESNPKFVSLACCSFSAQNIVIKKKHTISSVVVYLSVNVQGTTKRVFLSLFTLRTNNLSHT